MNILNGKTVACPVCLQPTEVIMWSVEPREVIGDLGFCEWEADPNAQTVKFLCGCTIQHGAARAWVDQQQAMSAENGGK